jgi:hypothetical protein
MSLRNAFENLATELKQDGIISMLKLILKSTTYAKDSNDRMRVLVDNASTVHNRNSSVSLNSSAEPWHSASSWSTVDGRENAMIASNINVNVAMQRWRIK